MCHYHTVFAADPARHGTDAGERFLAAMQVQFDAMNISALRRLLDAAIAYSDAKNDASTTSELLNAAKSLDHLYVDWHPLDPCWGKLDDHQAGKLVSAALLFACARRDDAIEGRRVSDKSRKRLDVLCERAKRWGTAQRLKQMERRKGGA